MAGPAAGSFLALELNDALLAVADASGVLHTEPGYAVVEEGGARFGLDALPSLRRQAHLASSRHWRDFSSRPLPRPLGGFQSTADLVAAQLRRLWARHGAGRSGVLYALPPGWTGGQRDDLLALSAALGMPVLAVADAAVAASRHEQPGRELLHLEAGLHNLTLSRIRQSGTAALGELAGDRESFAALGIEPLLRLSMETLARRFVECSRFDPLHDSATEQALFDQLPGWLGRLARDAEVRVELTARSGTFGAVIQSADFRARLARACEPLLQKLRARIAERGPHVLQVHHRLADLPGVVEALLRLPDTAVHILAPGAAAAGLAARAGGALRPGAGPAELAELPWDEGPADAPAVVTGNVPSAAAESPTHLLAGHQAYRVGDGPFRIGSELGPGEAGVVLDPGIRGLSRQHCTLRRENGALFVFDHSRFGTWLNGHRIEGAALVQPGDVLTLGSPPVELRLIAEADAG
ncbi:MAG: FHA domain-containing protein [Chromatiales bacterium]|nr:FHA domain-containing protein [Chromatiales bacterium]